MDQTCRVLKTKIQAFCVWLLRHLTRLVAANGVNKNFIIEFRGDIDVRHPSTRDPVRSECHTLEEHLTELVLLLALQNGCVASHFLEETCESVQNSITLICQGISRKHIGLKKSAVL